MQINTQRQTYRIPRYREIQEKKKNIMKLIGRKDDERPGGT